MPESYSIAMLAAERFMSRNGFESIDESGFACDEGEAQIVARKDGAAHLVMARAKRARGEAGTPTASEAKMRRIAMAYLIENPGVDKLEFDIIEAVIGERATVTIHANIGAYSWER